MDSDVVRNFSDDVALLNSLKIEAMVFLLVLFVLWLCRDFWIRRTSVKQLVLEQRGKKERAQQFREGQEAVAQSMEALASSVRTHDENSVRVLAEMSTALTDTSRLVHSLNKSVHALEARTSGVMSFQDSLVVVESYFLHLIRETQYIVSKSIEENNFVGREEAIARKVRTAIARVIETCRDNLRNIATLSLDPRRFFRVDIEAGEAGERFLICDDVWKAIRNNYLAEHGSLSERLEDARLRVENVINDHFTTVRYALTDENDKSTEVFVKPDSGSHFRAVIE